MALTVLLASRGVMAQEADTTPPDTTISEWDRPEPYEYRTNATFGFSSNEPNSTFECKLDDGSFQACSSPKSYYTLREGQHTFAVRAIDGAGNSDPTPAEYAWEIDLTDPKINWTKKPGNAIDRWTTITNDNTPTWEWTFTDKNLMEGDSQCELYDSGKGRYVVTSQPCPSPMTFPFELIDGYYYFSLCSLWHRDKAWNSGYYDHYFEVDTVAPKPVSGKPTGKTVGRYANVVVTLDDYVYNSAKFVNIYKKGSSTPLAISDRYTSGKRIELYLKNALKRGTWYTVKVTTGVNDGANKLAKPKTWHFKTKG